MLISVIELFAGGVLIVAVVFILDLCIISMKRKKETYISGIKKHPNEK